MNLALQVHRDVFAPLPTENSRICFSFDAEVVCTHEGGLRNRGDDEAVIIERGGGVDARSAGGDKERGGGIEHDR